jgi:TIR domain
MNENQIFISYSKKNKDYAYKIYDALLSDGHLVWIDTKIEEGRKWRPQIDHALKESKRFVVLISDDAIGSEWVIHETSMAYGRDLDIIPVKIKEYKPKELPLCVEEFQLLKLVEGVDDYDRGLMKLKNRLGPPVAIVNYIDSLLSLYESSMGKSLLSEHQLRLYEKHKKKIVWPEGKEALGREMVEKSRRELQKNWARYKDLEQNYMRAEREIDRLNRSLERDRQRHAYIYRLVAGFVAIVFIFLLVFAGELLLLFR